MVDTKRYKEWLAKALQDMRSAHILYEHGGDNDTVCYFCQQAAEKYLKGFLLKHTAVNQEGHNLVKLCKKAALYDRNLEVFAKDCAFLNTYYVETRYPQEDPLVVDEKDIQECLRIANDLMAYIDKVMAK